MSTTLVRELTEAVERGDAAAFAERCHADAVWEHNPGGGSPEEGTYRGREAIARLIERIVEGWEHMHVEIGEVSGADGVYRVRGELRFKHRISAAEMVEPYEQRLEFSDGLLSKGRMVYGS